MKNERVATWTRVTRESAPCPCNAAVLTPPGRGAIASVVVWGPDAVQRVGRLFTPATRGQLDPHLENRIVFGRWSSPRDGDLSVAPLTTSRSWPADHGEGRGEELVVTCHGSNHVEVHCHGGAAAVQRIVDSLVAVGCKSVAADQWVVEHERDRLVADASRVLPQAPTRRCAAILLDQYRGVLSRAVLAARQCCTPGDHLAACQLLQAMLGWSRFGQHLTQPWQIALIGPTNVGKSSLINALLGYQRALVCQQAGTTRDILTDITAVNGWPVEMADTAGLRVAENHVESEGIRRARQRAAAADLVLLVSDASRPGELEIAPWLAQLNAPPLMVHNKSDLISAIPPHFPPGLATSARTGAGIVELAQAISQRLVPTPPQPHTAIPFLPHHAQQLSLAFRTLRAHQHAKAQQVLEELVGS